MPSTLPCIVKPASRLADVAAYAPPPPAPATDLVLDSNEGPAPGDAVLRQLQTIDAEAIRRYPRPAALEAKLADTWNVDASRIVVTNGGDDAIDRLCRATLEPGRTLLTHSPTFEMIPRSARLAGAAIRAVPWRTGRFPTELLLNELTNTVGLVALVSPNNPTGQVIDTESIRVIAGAAADIGAAVLLDGAYAEFADEDPTPTLVNTPNLVVIRTFSKAFGLAGLRVGYAVAPESIAPWVRAAGGPYPVSSIALALTGAALDQPENTRRLYLDQVRRERALLTNVLRDRGAEPIPSQANFVTARFADAHAIGDALRRRGVRVRSFPRHSECADLLRITLPGDPPAFARLAAALTDAMKETAALPETRES